MELEELRRLVGDMLLSCGAALDRSRSRDGRPVRRDEEPDGLGFRLKLHERDPEAPLAPFYFNLGTSDSSEPGPLTDDAVRLIGELLWRFTEHEGLQYDAVIGLSPEGEPFATEFVRCALALSRRSIPLLGFQPQGGGAGRRAGGAISGSFRQGDKVLIVGGLCATADTNLETVERLREVGLVVEDMCVLIDKGGAAMLSQRGCCALHAVFTVRELFHYYRHRCFITAEVYADVMAYLRGPK